MTVVIAESVSARTYPPPASAQAEAKLGLKWAKTQEQPSEVSLEVARLIASGTALGENQLRFIVSQFMRPTVASCKTADGFYSHSASYPSPERVTWALAGGDSARKWARRLVAGLDAGITAANVSALHSIGFAPETYGYAGLVDEVNEDIITAVLRVPREGGDWECFTQSGWESCQHPGQDRVLPLGADLETLAMTASATLEGLGGVLLRYAEPVAWLSFTPLLAAVGPDDVEDFHVYAVVDATDTAAVMSVIALSPGPVGWKREAGQWVKDPATVSMLKSANPPPIVELGDDQIDGVLEQVDAAGDPNDPNSDAAPGSDMAVEPAAPGDPVAADPGTSSAPPAIASPAPDSTDYQDSPDKKLGADAANTMAQELVTQMAKDQEEEDRKAKRKQLVASLQAQHVAERHAFETRLAAALQNETSSREVFESDLHALEASGADHEVMRPYVTSAMAAESRRRTAESARVEDFRAAWAERDFALRSAIAAAAVHETRLMTNTLRDADVIYGASDVLESLTAAAEGGADRNRGGAEQLRRYWTHGKGALKIRWGAKGDWTRCYRQLSKYMGTRARGYCALRHKETTGMWTGDKRNK